MAFTVILPELQKDLTQRKLLPDEKLQSVSNALASLERDIKVEDLKPNNIQKELKDGK